MFRYQRAAVKQRGTILGKKEEDDDAWESRSLVLCLRPLNHGGRDPDLCPSQARPRFAWLDAPRYPPEPFRYQTSSPKFVIFFLGSENTMGVDVRVRLTRGWRFGHTTPEAQPEDHANGTSVYWELAVFVDGESPSMLDLESNKACDYLTWEAWPDRRALDGAEQGQNLAELSGPERDRHLALSGCESTLTVSVSDGETEIDNEAERLGEPEARELSSNFLRCVYSPLAPANALVLPITDFIPYLYETLQNLGMNEVFCSAFTALWLPYFQAIDASGQDIAFRFMSQAELSQWAALDVDADTVTRVFLVFEGVDTTPHCHVSPWAGRRSTRADAEAVRWAERTGIDVHDTTDAAMFRAVELGAWRWDDLGVK
ncbi:hypothetical protein GQ53DRAFT_847063 [Thozetella sp. PMI_491]|nr:hypothetical protein GQ53DRAFT_847063 [Thozetella sp. PMI_491]